VWAKGADYAGRELPEAAVLGAVGRRGRPAPASSRQSTTRIIEEASLRAIG
jgi:bifunctional ADP-heptose synthase (sugar kinase/adenylyltransferase)